MNILLPDLQNHIIFQCIVGGSDFYVKCKSFYLKLTWDFMQSTKLFETGMSKPE